MPKPMGDRVLVGFRVLDDDNKIVSEIWIDPSASRVNVTNMFPGGQVMNSDDISMQEFFDVMTAVRDRQRQAMWTEGPRGGMQS